MQKLSVAGKQFTKQDGTQGTEWTDVGVKGVGKNGKEYVMLDPKVNLAALPIGDNGMVMVSIIQETQNQGQQQNNQQCGQNQPQQNYQTPQPNYEDHNGQPQTQQQYQQNQNQPR